MLKWDRQLIAITCGPYADHFQLPCLYRSDGHHWGQSQDLPGSSWILTAFPLNFPWPRAAVRAIMWAAASYFSRLLFHKSKGSASFHPVESVDDLIPIEDGEELFQRVHWVARTRRNEFSEDAPGVLDSP